MANWISRSVGIKGDNYDRYYVRMREMDESVHMIRQLIELLPGGPINVDDRRCTLPEKRLVYTEIESLINHFKLIMEGPDVPAGEVYAAHEAPNGELGFYLVSTGGGTPYKFQFARQVSFTWAACSLLEKATSTPTSSRLSVRST
jgi:NADH-quinone oxidoreductase subunit D